MADPTSPEHVSSIRVMPALLAKDWRLYRLPIIGLIVAGVGAYLLAAGGESYAHADLARYSHYVQNHHPLFLTLEEASLLAGFLTALLASTFGGVAVAGERNDRTADFVALLPVSRGQIITSKFVVAGSALLAFTLFHALMFVLWASLMGSEAYRSIRAGALVFFGWQMGCLLSFFAVAWLVGTFTASSAINACISIAVTIAALLWMFRPPYFGSTRLYGDHTTTFLSLALSCLFAGTIYYLRRIAP